MKVSEAFPSKYLSVEDLDDQDMTVTIRDVTQEMLGQGADASLKLVVNFVEIPKCLACNKTNAKTIARVCGSEETADWRGKRITLWPNHDVEFKGDIVSAIRVRSRSPGAASASRGAAQPHTGNGVLTWKQALELCESVGIDEAELKQRLKADGFLKWDAAPCSPVVRAWVESMQEPPPPDNDDSIPF
jgi:hypothetical protein